MFVPFILKKMKIYITAKVKIRKTRIGSNTNPSMLIVPEYRYRKQKIQMLLQEASYLRVFVIKIYIQICDHSIWDDYDQALYSFTYFNLQVAIWWSDFYPFFPLEMIRIGLMFHYIDHLLKVRPIFICAHFLIVQYGRNEATKS